MDRPLKTRQRGISFFGLLFMVAVLACVGLVGAQAFPTVLEYQAAVKAINRASTGVNVAEVRQIFDKAADVDDIRAIKGRDLEITKNGDKVVVSFAYNKEIHLFGPAFLLLKYQASSASK